MKFTREVPTRDGWYWVAEQYHPSDLTTNPTVGHLSSNGWSVNGSARRDLISNGGRTYLFGSRIETPEVEVCDE